MNVPFSHPSEVCPQKDGRKVRSRWEGTFTFCSRRAPGRRARPQVPAVPEGRARALARRLARSYLGRRGRTFNVRPRCLRYDREAAPGRIPWPSGAARWIRAAPSSSRAWWCIGRCRVCRPGCDASETGPISARNSTDLDAEVNRSRRGSEPISTRNSTDLGEGWAASTLDTDGDVKQTVHVKEA